ncbi:MAG TPA: sigma 54-interacting transcriptional regulator [Symbiobacteriaceae bacterium]|nr:sigma 54-interacting transcriptional regulator [Symbiobacteriaceae bacterium]
MAERRPTVALLAFQEHTARDLTRQITSLLGDRIQILPCWVAGGPQVPPGVDLVFISSPSLASETGAALPQGVPVLVAKRSLRGTGLKEVLQIPAGTRVMLVNDHRDSAHDVVSLLYEFGVKHLDLLPYWPGEAPPDADVAITVNEPQYVPPGVAHVINIGGRVIDPTTVLDLMSRLGIFDTRCWQAVALYASEIPVSHGIKSALDQMRNLKDQLEVVLNLVQDAVIAVDERDCIIVLNQPASRLFDRNTWDLLGQPLQQGLPELAQAMERLGPVVADRVALVGSRQLVVTVRPILREGYPAGQVVICREVAAVQTLETKVRRELRQRGHVAKYTFDDLIGSSPAMTGVVAKARRLTRTDGTILIQGESGTGKELFAQAIHNASPRAQLPFVAINCASLPESLLESELFGYAEGAFTGARKGGKAGLFEQAHRGTIFLDEIGDISPGLQIRLLRVLQEKEVMRIGGSGVVPVDVRVIAATHQDLRRHVSEGRFRADLYYRLNVLRLQIPPLRDRRADILALLHFFLTEAGRPLPVSMEALARLEGYEWPGNVRELQNCAQYLAVVAGERVEPEDLPDEIRFTAAPAARIPVAAAVMAPAPSGGGAFDLPPDLRFLLKALAADPSGAAGRGTLARLALEAGMLLTEQEVRRRLQKLAALGLVAPGRGRGGTMLTPAGRMLAEGL